MCFKVEDLSQTDTSQQKWKCHPTIEMLQPKICGWRNFSSRNIKAELQDREILNAAECMGYGYREKICC